MPVLAHGDAYAYPYGFVNWTTAALVWPLFGNWAVTLWTALGAVGCIVATFTAFPELRRGWWAAAVLANPAILEALLFGQQSFAWGAMLLLFGVAAWRRGHPAAGPRSSSASGRRTTPRSSCRSALLLVASATCRSRPTGASSLRWYALSCVIALPAVWLVFASPTTGADAASVTELGELLHHARAAHHHRRAAGDLRAAAAHGHAARSRRSGSRSRSIGASRLRDPAERRPAMERARAQRRRHRVARRVPALARVRARRDVPRAARRRRQARPVPTCCAPAAGSTPRCSPRAWRSAASATSADYAPLLCDRHIDRIIHYDTYDDARHTNERR